MLVLVSFGLVLLATILLVVGLLSDDGLALIYLSIGASATAAIVLFAAFRLARPKGETRAPAPSPLADDIAASRDATAVAPAVEPAVVPEPAPAPAAPEPVPAPAEDDWANAANWEIEEDGVVDFPIAEYDDLRLDEIMPLLPQLYSDELDLVYEREANGQRRGEILAELDRLKETGTEADALEQAADVETTTAEPEPAAAPEPTPDPAPAPVASSPAPAPPAREPVTLLDADEDEDLFPIADYDDLSVSQIMPLLPQLELDELEDVRAREVAGADRSTLVAEIDRYLSGELEAFTWDDEDVAEEEPPAPIDPEAERLAIARYPELNVPEVTAQLDGLTPAQLERIRDYEAARDNRVGIVSEIDRRLEVAPPATTRRAARNASPRAASASKATKKTRTAPKKATTRATAKSSKSSKSSKSKASKPAKKATKKRANSRFPIANYDELTVADIRPRLSDLSDKQLAQVRERELSGAGRKTILTEIDRRLS